MSALKMTTDWGQLPSGQLPKAAKHEDLEGHTALQGEKSIRDKQPESPHVFQQQPAGPAFREATVPPVTSLVAYHPSKQQ